MVAEARAKLTLDGSQFSAELTSAGDKAKGLEKDLGLIGNTGSREFDNLQKGAGSLKNSVVDVSGEFRRYEKAGIDANKNIGAETGTLMGKIKQIGPAVVAAYAIKKIVDFGQQIMSTADQVDNMSKRLDTSAETVQSLDIVFKEAGLQSADFENAILKTARASVEARAGNEKLTEAFDKLGIKVSDLAGMNNEQIFERVTKAMADNKGNADVLSAAYEVIGTKAGPKLQSTLIEIGEKGFAALNQDMKDSNQILSDDAIKAWDGLGDSIAKVGRQIASFAGNLSGEVIQGVQLLSNVIKAGGWDEYNAGVEATNNALAETKKQAEEAAKAANERAQAEARIKAAKEGELALLKEIAELEEKSTMAAVDNRTNAEKIRDTKRDIENLLRAEANLASTGIEHYRDQLKIQVDIKGKREELAKLEAVAAKEQEKALAERMKDEQRLADLRKRLLDAQIKQQWDSLSVEDKIKRKEEERAGVIQYVNQLTEAGLINTEEGVLFGLKKIELEKELAGLRGKDVADKKEIKALTVEQVDAVERLKDIFKGMDEKEIAKFKESLQELAKALDGIAAPDLSWLGYLKNLDSIVSTGFIGGSLKDAAKKYGEALAEIVKAIDGAAGGKKIDLSWIDNLRNLDKVLQTGFLGGGKMEAKNFGELLALIIDPVAGKQVDLSWLDKLDQIKIPKLDKLEANEFARIMNLIVDPFTNLNNVDVGKLEKAVGLLMQLNFATPGKWEIEVKVPDDMKYGIPLVVPENLLGNLGSIDKSLNTLANLKGVVWA